MTAFDVELTGGRVSARLYESEDAARVGATLVLAHGAGAPHTSAFMVAFAEGLAARGLDVVTFNFPYMEAGDACRTPAPRSRRATAPWCGR